MCDYKIQLLFSSWSLRKMITELPKDLFHCDKQSWDVSEVMHQHALSLSTDKELLSINH